MLAPATASEPSYRDHQGVVTAARALADSSPNCAFGSLGQSAEGRDLILLTLSNDLGKADRRPALLITAGLDGRHLVGTETALRVAKRLATEHADLLAQITVYVIPLANPDGMQRNLTGTRAGHVGNSRPVDNDRDGLVDEDGPNDLNGDGVISQMRRLNPPLNDTATHMADPAEPRLLKKPDESEGERATYSIWIEGIDDDGDGSIAEDPLGAIDIDRNFMHEWPEHAPDAGPYQLSESEALALANFVLAHENIVMALTYGRHDNLVNTPDGKGKDVSGQGPKVIDPGDVKLYQTTSELYTQVSGQKRAPRRNSDGSFHAWLYAQRGVPSFTTVVWARPNLEAQDDEEAPDEAPAESEPDTEPGITGQWSGSTTIPEMGEMTYTFTLMEDDDHAVTGSFSSSMITFPVTGNFDPGTGTLLLKGSSNQAAVDFTFTRVDDQIQGHVMGPAGELAITATRQQDSSGAKGARAKDSNDKDKDADKPADAEAAQWLKYSDQQRAGTGFVAWAPYDHPTLGAVEIGGFSPGFRMNPPPEELDGLADAQTDFVVALTKMRPQLSTVGPQVTRLADGLYEVRLALVNDGDFPTATAIARKARAIPPTIVRVSTPVDRIVSGNRVNRAWGIDGRGGQQVFHWILHVDDGESPQIEIDQPHLAPRQIPILTEEVSP
jgi:hypothetical protein